MGWPKERNEERGRALSLEASPESTGGRGVQPRWPPEPPVIAGLIWNSAPTLNIRMSMVVILHQHFHFPFTAMPYRSKRTASHTFHASRIAEPSAYKSHGTCGL